MGFRRMIRSCIGVRHQLQWLRNESIPLSPPKDRPHNQSWHWIKALDSLTYSVAYWKRNPPGHRFPMLQCSEFSWLQFLEKRKKKDKRNVEEHRRRKEWKLNKIS